MATLRATVGAPCLETRKRRKKGRGMVNELQRFAAPSQGAQKGIRLRFAAPSQGTLRDPNPSSLKGFFWHEIRQGGWGRGYPTILSLHRMGDLSSRFHGIRPRGHLSNSGSSAKSRKTGLGNQL